MIQAAGIEKENRFYAAILTGCTVVLLFFGILWITFETPLPPFEGSGQEGIEVNFGFTDQGTGKILTELPPVTTTHRQEETEPEEASTNKGTAKENDFLTSDAAESHPVEIKKEVKVKKQKKEKKPIVEKKKTEPKTVTPAKPKPDDALANAFKNFKDGGNDGITGKPGNQGKENGTNTTTNYDGDGKGGDGGNGGMGDKGTGKIKFNLRGRVVKHPPNKITDFAEEGIIVVDIVVDQNGKVIEAEVNRAKSVNPNYVLCAKARQSALTTRFNDSNDNSPEQKGSITFEFRLK